MQLVHALPVVPQAWLSWPVRHWSPTQQPLQFVASHLLLPQLRVAVSHVRPSTEQSVQIEPKSPQAEGSVPARQLVVPPWKLQQPFEHDSGPQSAVGRAQTLPRATSHDGKRHDSQKERRSRGARLCRDTR